MISFENTVGGRRNGFVPAKRPAVGEAKDIGAGGTVLDYTVGDSVRHMKFGEGVVKNIVSGGRDYEVTVDFKGAGIKKMFASFAKLKKL